MNLSCVGIRTKNFHKNCYTRDNNQFVAENFLRVLKNNLQLSTVINNKHCSINSKFKKFDSLLIETINKHALLRKKACKELHQLRKPWITKNILHQIKKKN